MSIQRQAAFHAQVALDVTGDKTAGSLLPLVQYFLRCQHLQCQYGLVTVGVAPVKQLKENLANKFIMTLFPSHVGKFMECTTDHNFIGKMLMQCG